MQSLYCIDVLCYGNAVTSVDNINIAYLYYISQNEFTANGRAVVLYPPCLISTKFVLMKNVEFFIRIIMHGWLLSVMGHYPAVYYLQTTK